MSRTISAASQQSSSNQATTHSIKRGDLPTDIDSVARTNFGFEELRPGQRQAIEALLAGRDTLVVMPTGSGKSAIYQIAGLLLAGPVLVVSPLIALQKDQLDSINKRSIGAEAVVINSTLRQAETRATFGRIEQGAGKFIFLAPEQLRKPETVEALEDAGISLFVIDEAHCISKWGHDFRPDYLQLGSVLERLGHPVVLAMTATASERVRAEITQRLKMQEPQIFVHGFDRPNIHLRVDHFDSADRKLEALVHRVGWAQKPGIVYAGTRKGAEEVMRLLEDDGVRALFYHGGLKPSEREQIQDQFMGGQAEVIVATNAFGMGIDKAEIRFVYHYDISDSLDSYYQEIGRSGRDGEKAEAILFFRSEDLGSQAFKTGEGRLAEAQIEAVAALIAEKQQPVDPKEIAGQADLSTRKVTSAIHRLEDVGAVAALASGQVQVLEQVDLEEAAKAAVAEQERRRETKRDRLRQMEEYADTSGCRREKLLHYFGADFTGPCGNCDNCVGAENSKDKAGMRREVV